VADVEFDDLWQSGDDARLIIVEAVPGVTFEPEARRLGGGDPEAAELVIRAGRIAMRQRIVLADDIKAALGRAAKPNWPAYADDRLSGERPNVDNSGGRGHLRR